MAIAHDYVNKYRLLEKNKYKLPVHENKKVTTLK